MFSIALLYTGGKLTATVGAMINLGAVPIDFNYTFYNTNL